MGADSSARWLAVGRENSAGGVEAQLLADMKSFSLFRLSFLL